MHKRAQIFHTTSEIFRVFLRLVVLHKFSGGLQMVHLSAQRKSESLHILIDLRLTGPCTIRISPSLRFTIECPFHEYTVNNTLPDSIRSAKTVTGVQFWMDSVPEETARGLCRLS